MMPVMAAAGVAGGGIPICEPWGVEIFVDFPVRLKKFPKNPPRRRSLCPPPVSPLAIYIVSQCCDPDADPEPKVGG